MITASSVVIALLLCFVVVEITGLAVFRQMHHKVGSVSGTGHQFPDAERGLLVAGLLRLLNYSGE